MTPTVWANVSRYSSSDLRSAPRLIQAAELVRVGGGQAVVAGLGRQLDDRPRSQAAVEVVVEQDLGCPADGLERDGHGGNRTRPNGSP